MKIGLMSTEIETDSIRDLLEHYPYKLDAFYTHLGVDGQTIAAVCADGILGDIKKGAQYTIFKGNGDDVNGVTVYAESAFDTELTGLHTVKMKSIAYEGTSDVLGSLISATLETFSKTGIEFATYRFAAEDEILQHALTSHGFVKVDDYVILAKKLNREDGIVTLSDGISIRDAQLEDIPTLQENHAGTFRYSRFFNDPTLNEGVATELHRRWIHNSIANGLADKVFVAEDKGQPIGFLTLETKEAYGKKFGHVPLTGVRSEYSGRKIGKALMSTAYQWFAEQNLEYVLIETQGANIPAVNSYTHAGFYEVGRGVTYSWSSRKATK